MDKNSKNDQSSTRVSIPIIVISVLVIVGVFAFFVWQWMPKDGDLEAVDINDSQDIDIEIPSGTSIKGIASILKENDLIKGERAFIGRVQENDYEMDLKAGDYLLNRSMDVDEIIDILRSGKDNHDISRLTIPEGYELEQIGERLEENNIGTKDEFLELTKDKSRFEDDFIFLKEIESGRSLEGFLFPATYDIEEKSQEDLVKEMLAAFESVYESDIKDNLANVDMTLNEAVTLASIIEREGKLDEERATISAVFHNRIKQGMPLQSCATVQYILGERKAVLTNKDTSIDSPYNTYKNKGLPPGPISSSGKISLQAAVNPEDVDYLFFVLTGEDGSHTFTTNYDDHLNAKPKK